MCGIFGSYAFNGDGCTSETLKAMAQAIVHRGPDAMGYRAGSHGAIGNCRLSIIDLSDNSNQPLYSEDGNLWLVQNGEIYNYIELRDELQRAGCVFHTQGDTEVLLRAYEYWGPTFVTRLNGMFTIAIMENDTATLRLYRDRLGVKPLYLAGDATNGRMWFASEIKAILAAGFPAKANYDALAQYLALNYIPSPATAFEGVTHLPPAHYAQITAAGVTLHQYWNLHDVQVVPDMTPAEAKAGLIQLLDDATRLRMRADAPFGAFLSGGLDSSSVVGFMSMYQSDPVHTFSIGFDDQRFDETHYANMAAERFGTFHQRKVTQYDASSLWAKFIWHVDQPHGDVSFIPMYQVSALAATDVKMVLTGDGGDELFAGYDKYLSFFGDQPDQQLPAHWQDAYVRQSGLLHDNEPEKLLTGTLHSAFHDQDPYRALSAEIRRAADQDPVNQVLAAETLTLLPGNNLVKPDRMAMANSLEVRSPFLDYRMAEFAFQVPGALKLRDGETKAIYKDAVAPLLGDTLTWRKKQMFTVPIGEWFRQSLAGYARDILGDGRLGARGIVNADNVSAMLEAHIGGTANYTRQLRALISLEIWFRIFIDKEQAMLDQAQMPQGAF